MKTGKIVMSKRICVKVKNLRKLGYSDLRKWCEDENNVLVIRNGRIFINKEIFCYKKSEWCNMYKLKNYTLEECLILYEKWLRNEIKDEEKKEKFKNLNGMNLGCFCDINNNCHVDIIIKFLNEIL